jgi:transposase
VATGNLPSPARDLNKADASGQSSLCEIHREFIEGRIEQGLSAVRIYQDLKAERGYAGGYNSVKRFVRKLKKYEPDAFRRMEVAPGEEMQVDFGVGAPVEVGDGKMKKPWLFRMVLSHSRKAYSEVVWRQDTESFIRAMENAFRYFGGTPKTVVTDNLKAAVEKADWHDPTLNPKLESFAEHYSFALLPCRPRTPRHKGKVERCVGYAQSNALKPEIPRF